MNTCKALKTYVYGTNERLDSSEKRPETWIKDSNDKIKEIHVQHTSTL